MSSKTLAKFLEENLEDLKSKGLYNVIDPLESSNGYNHYNWRKRIY